jgi:hypothetical protein
MSMSAQSAASVLQRAFAALLVALLVARPAELSAAAPVAPPAAALPAPQPGMLQINILEGEGALNNIRARTAREPIVEVQDENHKPVAGALILFSIRPGGAGGTFNGSATTSLYTDANGQAVAHGFMPNARTGRYVIKVTAVVGAVTAFALIHERNVRGAGDRLPEHKHVVLKSILIGGVVVGVIVAIILLTRKSPTGITAGAGGVGIP